MKITGYPIGTFDTRYLKLNQTTPQTTVGTFTFPIVHTPTINGSVLENGDLTLQGTTHATRTTSYVILQPNGGNVGIGTTGPAFQLHIDGADGVNPAVGITAYGTKAPFFLGRQAGGTKASPSATQAGERLFALGGGGWAGTTWSLGSTAQIKMLAAENFTLTNQGAYITFETTPLGSTALAERLRITSEGNVGIGTTSPEAPLNIIGSSFPVLETIRTTATTNDFNSGMELITRSSGDVTDGFGGGFVFALQDTGVTTNTGGVLGAVGAVRAGADNTGDLIFRTYTTGTGTEKVRITSGGNVGIGTTAPGAKLDVNGGVVTTSGYAISANLSTTTAGIYIYGALTSAYYYGNSPTAGYTFGYDARSGNQGTSTLARAYGVNAGIYNTSSGTITSAYGLASGVSNTSGTIVNRFGAYISDTAGTTTNNYGIYLENQDGGGTLNYSIYSLGGTMYHLGNIGVGVAPSASIKLQVQETKTDLSGSPLASFFVDTRVNPAGASSANFVASRSIVQSLAACAQNISGLTGVYNQVYHAGSGVVSTAIGMQTLYTSAAGSGNVTLVIGNDNIIQNASASTIGTAYGIRIQSATNSGGGAITTFAGLYIANQTVGGTNYSIYTNAGANSLGDVLLLRTIKSGATQAGAGAAANEIWKTASHATLPDNVLMIGV